MHERIDIDRNLYLLIGSPMGYGTYMSGCRPPCPDKILVRKVSVISIHRGGEIRGYFLSEGMMLYKTLPDYVGAWPEVDHAVERVLRARIAGGVEPYPLAQGRLPFGSEAA